MHLLRGLCAASIAFSLAGCADILPWPGFESHPAIFSYAEQLPAAEVAEQVRCELAEFLREEQAAQNKNGGHNNEGPYFLDPTKGAQIQLKLSTDLQGSATYLGINLKGLGLDELAKLVTKTNNVPSLQLKAQGKSTQTSQIDFVIPQTMSNTLGKKNGKPVELPDNLVLPNPEYCGRGNVQRFMEYRWFRLWLADALKRYKKRLNEQGYQIPGETFADRVCQPKLTISTQFQLLFDVSAGTNIFQALPVILPISGLNIDASPDYTHFIQIIFSLRPDGDDEPRRTAACQMLQTTNPPSHI